jgi:hypothetical protein
MFWFTKQKFQVKVKIPYVFYFNELFFLVSMNQTLNYLNLVSRLIDSLEQGFSIQITPRPVFFTTTCNFGVKDEKQPHLIVSLDQF